MTQAQQAVATINAYVAGRSVEEARSLSLNVWEAVIQHAEGYDEQATAKADPSHTNVEAVFADGSRLWWNFELNAWETGPAGPGAAEDAIVLGNDNRSPSLREGSDAPQLPNHAIAMLQDDHRKVQDLFARYHSVRDFNSKQQIVTQVFTELDLHAQLEETVFYPAFDTQAGKKGTQLVADSRLEHAVVKELMLEMQSLDIAEEEFEDKFEELMKNVQHHIAQEEHEMFPEAAQILADQLKDLRDEMIALKHQLTTALRQ
jgi:hemerythrin superfamily protein